MLNTSAEKKYLFGNSTALDLLYLLIGIFVLSEVWDITPYVEIYERGGRGGISLPSPNMASVNEGRLNLSVVPSASNNVVIATNVGGRRVCGAGGVEVLQCRHWKQMEGCVRCRRPDVCCKAAAVDAQKKRKHILCTLQCEIIFCYLFRFGVHIQLLGCHQRQITNQNLIKTL